jgi:hypothetical protein
MHIDTTHSHWDVFGLYGSSCKSHQEIFFSFLFSCVFLFSFLLCFSLYIRALYYYSLPLREGKKIYLLASLSMLLTLYIFYLKKKKNASIEKKTKELYSLVAITLVSTVIVLYDLCAQCTHLFLFFWWHILFIYIYICRHRALGWRIIFIQLILFLGIIILCSSIGWKL